MIAELDDEAVVCRAGDEPYALGDFLRVVGNVCGAPPPAGGFAAATAAGAARSPTSPSTVTW
jgi:hypothetical protein